MSDIRQFCALAAILSPEDYDVWLDPPIREVEHLQPPTRTRLRR